MIFLMGPSAKISEFFIIDNCSGTWYANINNNSATFYAFFIWKTNLNFRKNLENLHIHLLIEF